MPLCLGAVFNYRTLANRMIVRTSKYLDYQNWLEAHERVISKKYRSIDGTAKLVELKNSMIRSDTKLF